MEIQFGSAADLRRQIRQDDGAEPEVVRRSFDGGDDRFDFDPFAVFRQKDFLRSAAQRRVGHGARRIMAPILSTHSGHMSGSFRPEIMKCRNFKSRRFSVARPR
ncbi:hypothetical protein [Rhodoblastus sp.]|uniref:hypothetical protein n=1 Tax=Rhodoblastus sp. TaxID=1962975 RepID=UPI0035B0BD13